MDRSLGKMVVGNILATAAIRYPDAPAIYCSSTDRRFSFGEINDRTNRLAQALLGLGFRKGDVVAFLTSNRAEIVEIYFALARTGIVGHVEITPKQLDDFCRQHLAGFKTPKEFIIETEALPRTPTGKVQKFLLVERFGSQRR